MRLKSLSVLCFSELTLSICQLFIKTLRSVFGFRISAHKITIALERLIKFLIFIIIVFLNYANIVFYMQK